jgi:Glucose / Sorbosone dehydrogenase
MIAPRLVVAGAALLATAPVAAAARSRLFIRADFPAAMAALPHGGLVYGELVSGKIWRVDAHGHRSRAVIARVRASSNGLKGLLGLAVDPRGRVFAAFTSAGRNQRLLVERVSPGRARVVWRGPPAHSEANGGRLAFTRAGRLLVSLGDRDRSITISPTGGPIAPPWPGLTGSIVSLDPDGNSSQIPTSLATGWFNPFGLAVTPSGAVWVADNAVGDDEHLARADLGPKPQRAVKLPHIAPTGIAAEGERDLYVCGFVSRRLDHYRVGADGVPHVSGKPLARDCAIGVIRLSDDQLAYANEHSIRLVRP